MTEHDPDSPAVNRRLLLRGGAVLAGAAGVSVVGAALGPTAAHAADGDPLTIGTENTGTKTTSLKVAGGSDPALTLANPNGPALRLEQSEEFDGELAVGDLVMTSGGAVIGVDYGDGPEASYLLTDADLGFMPVPVAFSPERILDTRKSSGRSSIVRSSSSSPLDSDGRLKAGRWIDVEVAPADLGLDIASVFINVTSAQSAKNGYLTVYAPSDDRPTASNVSYIKGQASGALTFAPTEIYNDSLVVRIWTSQTSAVIVDLQGGVVSDSGFGELKAARRTVPAEDKRATRMKKALQRSIR